MPDGRRRSIAFPPEAFRCAASPSPSPFSRSCRPPPTTPAPIGAARSADGGKCCASLAEVRQNIDRIDQALVRLMAERQQYVGEAGRFKKDPAAVSDPKRVDAVVAKVRADATAQDLDPAVAEATFRAMIARLRGLRARRMDAPAGGPSKVAGGAALLPEAPPRQHGNADAATARGKFAAGLLILGARLDYVRRNCSNPISGTTRHCNQSN